MTKDEIIEMANQVKLPHDYVGGGLMWLDKLEQFAKLVAEREREACIALYTHEDVLAPIGHSAWGEAYQDGWCEGTGMYRKAIEARGKE